MVLLSGTQAFASEEYWVWTRLLTDSMNEHLQEENALCEPLSKHRELTPPTPTPAV